ncbi:MAG: hypothetical protein AAGH92_02885 [Planctomycetota bacterium]
MFRPNLEPVPVAEAPAWLAGWTERAKAAIGSASINADPPVDPIR